jgi:hypothetical protein
MFNNKRRDAQVWLPGALLATGNGGVGLVNSTQSQSQRDCIL